MSSMTRPVLGLIVAVSAQAAACHFDTEATPSPVSEVPDAAPQLPGPPTCSTPLLEDAFDDGAIAAVWETVGSGATEADSELRIVPTTQSELHGLRTTDGQDVRGTRAAIALATAPDAATSGVGGIRFTTPGESNFVAFEVSGGVLAATVRTPDRPAPIHTVAYDPSAHRHLSVVEDAGTLAFEVSTDGASWSPFARAPTDTVMRNATTNLLAADNLGEIDAVTSFYYVQICPLE